MTGKCDYCGEVKRISKKTKFCAACVRQFNTTVDEFFDGDPFAPLRYAAQEIAGSAAPPAEREKPWISEDAADVLLDRKKQRGEREK